uniref:Uncharacterized protein n=1 Tax=Apteryx owenii TaxID=8824 RepID=A0A8B9QQA7_APTOW
PMSGPRCSLCFLLLLLQKEILGCPSVCRLCTGRQVNCRNLGLSSIPRNFPQNTVLVYLTFNNITELQPEVLKPLVSLTHLQLNYNPWNCSCKMLRLHKWLASSSVSVKIHCQSPLSMRGRPLHYIKWTPFANCSSPTASPEKVWNLGSVDIHHSTATLLMACVLVYLLFIFIL